MNLLYEKQTQGSKGIRKDVISVSNTIIAIRRDMIKRLSVNSETCYAGLGIDNERNLFFFFTKKYNSKLFKITKPNHKTDTFYVGIPNHFKSAIKPYMGEYKVGNIKIVEEIYECELIIIK